MVGSIVVVGVLACALLCSMRDLKASQMNVQHRIIWRLTLYEFELSHNVAETSKNIFCTISKGAIDYCTETKSFKKFCLGCKNLKDLTRSGRCKTVDSKAVLQATETNPLSNTMRVSGELSISQFSVVQCELSNYTSSCQNIARYFTHSNKSQVGWGCRIHQLYLCRVLHSLNKCPGYDIKQSDSDVPVMLELWGKQSTPLLPSLPGLLCLKVVAPDRVRSIGQIEL